LDDTGADTAAGVIESAELMISVEPAGAGMLFASPETPRVRVTLITRIDSALVGGRSE
jgi:hypothetical protein